MADFKNQIHSLTAFPPEFEITECYECTGQGQKGDQLQRMRIPEISDPQQNPPKYRINAAHYQPDRNSQQAQNHQFLISH